GEFIGLITDEAIFDAFENIRYVNEAAIVAQDAIVSHDKHYYEVLKKAYSLGVRLVAVSDENGDYIGVISVEDVVEAFASASSVQTPGAILVLSMEMRDYSLSEISRLIESNDVMILSTHILPDAAEPGKIQLTIKTNKEEITHVAATLEARGFHVAKSYTNVELTENDQDRYDSLMHYLKI
ncbi:MAG: acetoin utilization protein AcuB, partial [Paraglaciecola sp.]